MSRRATRPRTIEGRVVRAEHVLDSTAVHLDLDPPVPRCWLPIRLDNYGLFVCYGWDRAPAELLGQVVRVRLRKGAHSAEGETITVYEA